MAELSFKGIRDALLTNKVQQIWWPLSSLHPDLVQVVEGLRNDFVHCLGTVPSFCFWSIQICGGPVIIVAPNQYRLRGHV